MGFGGISIWQLLIILVIVLLLFGTKRLRSLGSDLGNAIKGFRGAMSDAEQGKDQERLEQKPEPEEKVIDGEMAAKEGEATSKEKDKA
jgi:sec-independent protein translocase protein TatA